jgi:ankyrin repeat protein
LHHGHAHFAALYLKYNANPDTELASGDTTFFKTITRTGPAHLVDLLLIYEATVNKKNARGETPLFVAINVDHPDIVTTLLDNGANPNLPGPKHMLWPSVHHPIILESLLEKGADLRRAPGMLELATSINSTQAVTILLNHGVDVNAKKDGIFTPLCTAIRDDDANLVDILLKVGADPNLPAFEYPAFKCVTHHRAHLLLRLLAAGANAAEPKGIIEPCVAHNHQDALILLLNAGLDPDACDAARHTALTTAIQKDDLGYIDILLSSGPDAGVRGHDWPMNMAVKNLAVLAKLLPHLTVPNIPKGALELAVQANQLESVKLLLQAGVEVEDKNGEVFSPLTTAIREDRKEIFRYLLDEAGADPNRPGEHSPIIEAIPRHREDDMSYISHLLEKGADMNLTYRGWNAVLQALDKGDAKTLQLLADMGTPDLSVTDEEGMSVLDIMRLRGMNEEEIILTGGGSASGRPKKTGGRARAVIGKRV